MYTVTGTQSAEQAKISGAYPIQLFVVNASPTGYSPLYYVNLNQDVYGYQMNSSGSLTATEVVYTGLPVDLDPMETNIKGEVPEVNISVPNINRALESIIQTKNYLRGCDVHVISMFADHLPASSLDYRYIGKIEDKRSAMIEKFYIDSTSSNEQVVSFSCKPKFIIKNMVLPGRKYSRMCAWDYSATGNCMAGAATVASWTSCDYTLKNCRTRGNSKRFGGFVSIPSGGIWIN